jgi:hypothetical protein
MSNSANIILRLIAATVGAYGVSAIFSLAIVPVFIFILSSRLSDAVYAATMWSYVIFFLIFIASFAISSVKKVYFSLLAISGCCYGVFLLASTFSPMGTDS